MPDRDGSLGAPDHLHGDLGPPSTPRSQAELEAALRGARRSRNGAAVAGLVGVAVMFLVPVRLLAVLGFVAAFLAVLVVVVASIQIAMLRGKLEERDADGDEE